MIKKDFVTPPALAVIFALVGVTTGLVSMLKLLAVFPSAIETVDGT